MTAPRTVSLFSDEPGWGRALVASLPSSLRRIDGPTGEIALIDGRGDWPDATLAQVERGCRHVMLVDPAFAAVDKISRLTDAVEASGALCIVSESVASNPAIFGFREWLGPDFGTIALESIDATPANSSALTQLRLLRALGIDAIAFSHVTTAKAAYLAEAEGRLAGRNVHIRLVFAQSSAGPARHVMTAFAPASCARLELARGGEALPAKACMFTTNGVETLPSIHESAHRHHLRALLDKGSGGPADALRALIEDMASAEAMRGI